jgi:hypothetical protein
LGLGRSSKGSLPPAGNAIEDCQRNVILLEIVVISSAIRPSELATGLLERTGGA